MFWVAPHLTETEFIRKDRTLWIWHGLLRFAMNYHLLCSADGQSSTLHFVIRD